MRLHIGILLLITVILQIISVSRCESTIENGEDSRLSTGQVWEQGNDPEVYRDDYEIEPEMSKRGRNRVGKRRKRVRHRIRTTEHPPDIEEDKLDKLHTAATSIEESENDETVLPPPRRRPVNTSNGKRRRRPLRRYHDSEQPIGNRSRRRKGNRKRIRPHLINTDSIETTTYISLDYDSPVTNKITVEEMKTERTLEIDGKYNQEDNDKYSSNLEINSGNQEEVKTNDKEIVQQQVDENTNDTQDVHNEVPSNREENIIKKQNKTENEFNNKITFDRKRLFSNSRRLPETSATIRRKLIPKIKNSTYDNHIRIIKPLTNLESETEINEKDKDEIEEKLILNEEYRKMPEIIEPYQLINKIKSQLYKENNYNEPNYPKLDSFLRKNITEFSVESKENTPVVISTTELIQEEVTNYIKNEEKMEIKLDKENLSIKSNNSNNNLTNNFDDELMELLKSDIGKKRLQEILELRNMTFIQLIDHRERGSSKFHLQDIFSKTEQKTNGVNKTVKQEDNLPLVKEAHEEISTKESISSTMSSFIIEYTSLPKYNQTKFVNSLNSDLSYETNQYREPRIFDSLPEFTSTKASIPQVNTYPTIRIIPNPKLKPVSVRGDYKEIKISNIKTTDKPNILENDIDKIHLLEEKDNYINYENKAASTVVKKDNRDNIYFFRKIPVNVKSTIVISGAILVLAIFGFLSVLVSCKLKQKKARLRAKQDILCEHLQQSEDFMASQHSLSPVLNKHHNRGLPPVFTNGIHSQTPSNRHYYLWRTLRKTFQYD